MAFVLRLQAAQITKIKVGTGVNTLVILFKHMLNARFTGSVNLQRPGSFVAQKVHGLDIVGVQHSHYQAVLHLAYRHGHILFGDVAWQQGQHFAVNMYFRQVDIWYLTDHGQGFGELLVGNVAFAYQQAKYRLMAIGGLVFNLIHLGVGNQPVRDQDFFNLLLGGGR